MPDTTLPLAEFVKLSNEATEHLYASEDGPHAVRVAGVSVSLAVEIHEGQPRLHITLDTDGADDEVIQPDGLHYVFEQAGYLRLARDEK